MTNTPSPDQHMAAARKRLCHLAGLAQRTEDAERKILESATHRRAAVTTDIDKLRPRVNLDPAAADRYQALVQERGTLDIVLANAQQALGQTP